MYKYLRKELPELQTEKEKEIAIKRRNTAIKLNHDIKKLVNIISDYSVYQIFEPLSFISICKPSIDVYRNCWERAIENDNLEQEKSIYRRKVYYILKNSGYDDGYVEDNIENLTDVLISFYTNPKIIQNYLSLYNEGNEKKKIKARHIDK